MSIYSGSPSIDRDREKYSARSRLHSAGGSISLHTGTGSSGITSQVLKKTIESAGQFTSIFDQMKHNSFNQFRDVHLEGKYILLYLYADCLLREVLRGAATLEVKQLTTVVSCHPALIFRLFPGIS